MSKNHHDWFLRVSEVVRRRTWWVLAAGLLLLALYVVLARQLMAQAPEWREFLADTISEQLGAPVTLGRLEGRLDGLTPVLSLEDVRVSAAESTVGVMPLHVDKIELAIDVLASLIHRVPRLQRLTAQGLGIHLERPSGGMIRLKGLNTNVNENEPQVKLLRDILEPLYRQKRVELFDVHAIIDWDGLPRMETRDLAVTLVSSGQRHYLAVAFSMLDQPLELDARLRLRQDAYKLQDVDGRGYLRLSGQGLEHWLPEQWPWAIKPRQANGEIRLWSRISQGEIQSANLQLETRALELKHDNTDWQWTMDSLFAGADFSRSGEGYRVQLSGLQASTATGDIDLGPLSLRWWPVEPGRQIPDAGPWQLDAGVVDLTALRHQLLAWPFPMAEPLDLFRTQLQSLEPGGRVTALQVNGHGNQIEQVQARFDDLSLTPEDGRPGISGVSGWVQGGPDEGWLRLQGAALEVTLPGAFAQPIMAEVGGSFYWQRDEQDFRVQSGRIKVANDDARGEVLFALSAEQGRPPELSLTGALTEGNLANADRYIPLLLLSDNAAHWFEHAFLAGHVTLGRFLYQGPVNIDSQRQQERTFMMSFAVEEGRMHFLDGWPALEEVSGTAVIGDGPIRAQSLKARLFDARLRQGNLAIVDQSGSDVSWLHLSGALTGKGDDLNRVFNDTPLAANLPDELRQWQFTQGTMDGHLLLNLPLGDEAGHEVIADMQVSGLSAQSTTRGLELNNLEGQAYYSLQQGLQAPRVEGYLLQQPINASIASDDEHTRFRMQGQMPLATLKDWLDWKWLTVVTGKLPYEAELQLPRQLPRQETDAVRLDVFSDLQGVVVKAPAPLGKTESNSLDFHFQLWPGQHSSQQLTFAYGQHMAGSVLIQDAQVEQARLMLGSDQPPRIEGPSWQIDGQTPELDLLAWVDFLTQDQGLVQDTFLQRQTRVAIETASLSLGGVAIGSSQLRARQQQAGWQLDLAGEQMAGSVNLPSGYQPDGHQPMDLALTHLHLATAGGNGLSALSPGDIPIANVSLDRLTLDDEDFGRWRGQLRPYPGGVRVMDFEGEWRHARIQGELEWHHQEEGQYSAFRGEVVSNDMRRLLQAWDMDVFMESADVKAISDVRWSGSPLDFDYLAMQGNVQVDIRDALLPGSDRRTSALQLLGLVNIGNITRRLRLDFSDASRRGLLCERIQGTLYIDGAEIATEDLRIRSTAAEFAIKGQLNINEQSLDHQLDMTLPISSNLYAGCLAGPAACAGIFVLERLWGDRIEKLATMTYRVKGTWQDPKVEEITLGRGRG